jgi:Protein of unknown function (DUF3574)
MSGPPWSRVWRCHISTRLVLFALLLLGACAPQQQTLSCAAPLKPAAEVDLFYGAVSDADWASYLAEEVTPRFPEGLTVLDAAGQWRDPSGVISRERSKLLILIVFDAPGHLPKVQAMIDAYLKRFHQQAVLHTEHAVCAG